MFEIKESVFPKEIINCESCGCHGEDLKSILIYQAVKRNGRMQRIGGRIVELRLCGACRCEMGRLLSE